MRRISQREFERTKFVRIGGNKAVSAIGMELTNLPLNTGIEILKQEWNLKSSPAGYTTYIGQKLGKKFTVRTLADKSGWMIFRIA